MDTRPATEPTDLTRLSDKELIQRYCEDQNREDTGAELWRRHQQRIYEELEKCSRSLCPAFYDWRDLVHDSFVQARKNLLARICEFRELDSVSGLRVWLRALCRSTMRDERRKVTQSRRKNKIREVSIQSPADEGEREAAPPEVTEDTLPGPPELAPESVPVEVLGSEVQDRGIASFEGHFRSDYLYFRSRYSTSPLDPAAPVEWEKVERERTRIFREILTRHAQRSDEDATCAMMIRLRYWKRWPVAKLVDRFYGPSEAKRVSQARHRAYYRLLETDFSGIMKELTGRHGVARPEQI